MSKSPTKSSALHEKKGVLPPETINLISAKTIQNYRKKVVATADYVQGILQKDITTLSRAITLVESTNPDHLVKANEVIQACLPFANQSIRIGITGVPGVGKSTFIEAFGKHLTGLGKRVAVLAVDPSSTL